MDRKWIGGLTAIAAACAIGWYSNQNHAGQVAVNSYVNESVIADEGRAASTTASSRRVINSAVDSVMSLDSLSATVSLKDSVRGDARFDAEMAAHHAASLCGYLYGSKNRTFRERAGSLSVPDNALAMTSYELVDRYRTRFCGADLNTRQNVESDAYAVAALVAANNGSVQAKRLADAQASLEAVEEPVNVKKIQNDLLDVLQNTSSPGMFSQAANMLGDESLGGFVPAGFEIGDLTDDDAYMVSQFGMQLASCREFGYCDRQNLFSMRSCMPAECRGNGTLIDYMRGRLSPTMFDAVDRYATALLGVRHGT